MPRTHKQKASMARRWRTPEEVGQSVGLFQSSAWRTRKFRIMKRVERQQIRARYWAEFRRGERGNQLTKEL